MAPEFTDEQVRAIWLMLFAYGAGLVVVPSIVLAHLFGLLGLPKIRLATPFLVAVAATAYEHELAAMYVLPCLGMLLLLLWERPRFLFGNYGAENAWASRPAGEAGTPGGVAGRLRARFASLVEMRTGTRLGPTATKLVRIVFWVVVLLAHYLYAYGALRLSTVRSEATWMSATAVAELLAVLGIAVWMAITSGRTARALGWRIAPAFLGSGLAFVGAFIVGLLILSVLSFAVLSAVLRPGHGYSEVHGAAMVVGAPLQAAPAAWVLAVALAPLGADHAYAARPGVRAGSAVSHARHWAATGSVLAHVVALQNPVAGLLIVPAIVIALSGAGYLRAVGQSDTAHVEASW